MGRDTVQLETAVNTISQEYLLEFTSEYGIPKTLHPELPGPEDRILDFLEGKVGVYTRFFEFANFRFPLSQFLFDVLGWMTFSKRPEKNTPNVTPSPWTLSKTRTTASFEWTRECSRPSWTGERMLPKTGCRLLAYVDLFNLIRAPNPTKVKTGSRPCAPHEVPLLTLTATRVIEMDDPAAATDSSGVSSTIEKSPLDFADEAGVSDQGTVAPEMPPSEDVPATDAPGAGQAEEVVATDPPVATESRKRGRDETDGNAPPKSLRRDHADPRPTGSSHGGKSLAAIQLGLAPTVFVPENAPAGVSDPDPLSFVDPSSRHPADIPQSSQGTAAAGDPDSENAFSSVEVRSSESGNGVTAAPEVRARGKAAEEVRCSSGSPGQKNSSPGAGNKKPRSTTRDRGRYEEGCGRQECWANPRIRRYACPILGSLGEQRAFIPTGCYPTRAELDARLDALSIDFDEELYLHMLTAIAGRRWVIGHGLRLAVVKFGESLEMGQAFADVVSTGIAKGMSECLRHGVEHGQAQPNVESIEAYDPEAEAKFFAALQALKDLKYPLVDQLEVLKDAPMDVIMAALYLKSDTEGDASQYIRDLRLSSSQLTIPVYPEVGSAHHVRSDGVPVSVPTVVPQGLAILLVDAATQSV
nr:transposase (putative), gypsy type [Tanacetum cinerariifolium]